MPTLIRHPQSPTLAVSGLQAEVSLAAEGDLLIRYQLTGDLSRLRLPPPLPTARLDGLWRHTCFELFVAGEGEAYREFNFSPAGHWQAFTFTTYRQGGHLDPVSVPLIQAQIEANCMSLDVRLPAIDLPSGPRLRLGLTAVLEATDGRLAYWALRHGAEQADFHRADSFTLALVLSGNAL